MDRASIDDAQLRTLAAEGLSPTAIAQRLGLPRSRLSDSNGVILAVKELCLIPQ